MPNSANDSNWEAKVKGQKPGNVKNFNTLELLSQAKA